MRLGLGAEHVERVRRYVVVGRRLQRQQPDLRAVAVGDDDLVAGRDRGDALRLPIRMLARWFSAVMGLPALQQRVAAEGDHDAHDVAQPPARPRGPP